MKSLPIYNFSYLSL